MLFKDLKQLGRGRRNSNDPVAKDDESAVTTADIDSPDVSESEQQQAAEVAGHTATQESTTAADAEDQIQDTTTVSELKRMNDDKASAETDADDSNPSESGSGDPAATTTNGAEPGGSDSSADADNGSAKPVSAEPESSTAQSESELVEKMEKYREDYVRAVAELQNVKRRSESDISKAKKYGSESMARGLLDVKDSLDLARGVDLSDAHDDAVSKMQEGLNLTLKQLETVLDKHGVKPVSPAMGDKLDPALHQAMSMQPSSTVKPNHVLAVVQTGYQLHDRLLRAAMVVVATAEDTNSAEKADGGQQEAKNED